VEVKCVEKFGRTGIKEDAVLGVVVIRGRMGFKRDFRREIL
jgi:hypothetical protein